MVHSRRVMVARARPRASRSRAKHSMSARRAWNRRRCRCWHQAVNWRRSSAYASRVKPVYPARNPVSASRSWWVNTGATGMRAAGEVVVVIGHLLGRAGDPGGWARGGPSDDNPPLPLTDPVDHATSHGGTQPTQRPRSGARRIAEYERLAAGPTALTAARR